MSCFNRRNNSYACDDIATTIIAGTSENNNNCCCNCCNCGCGNVGGTSCNRRCGANYYVTNSDCDCAAEAQDTCGNCCG